MLEPAGCYLWIPTFKVRTSLWKESDIREKWWFPGYVFVIIPEPLHKDIIWNVENHPGVYFLRGGERPYILNMEEKKTLYEKVMSKGEGDFIEEDIQPGDTIAASIGIIDNMKGTVSRITGSTVDFQITLFGRTVKVSTDKSKITKI